MVGELPIARSPSESTSPTVASNRRLFGRLESSTAAADGSDAMAAAAAADDGALAAVSP